MSRRNWDAVAEKQFESLSNDIREQWGDLREITLNQDR